MIKVYYDKFFGTLAYEDVEGNIWILSLVNLKKWFISCVRRDNEFAHEILEEKRFEFLGKL